VQAVVDVVGDLLTDGREGERGGRHEQVPAGGRAHGSGARRGGGGQERA
jgi:hypothetical protein